PWKAEKPNALEIGTHRERCFLSPDHRARQRRAHRPADDQFVPAPWDRWNGQQVLHQPNIQKRVAKLCAAERARDVAVFKQSLPLDGAKSFVRARPDRVRRRHLPLSVVPSLSASTPCGKSFIQPVRELLCPPLV